MITNIQSVIERGTLIMSRRKKMQEQTHFNESNILERKWYKSSFVNNFLSSVSAAIVAALFIAIGNFTLNYYNSRNLIEKIDDMEERVDKKLDDMEERVDKKLNDMEERVDKKLDDIKEEYNTVDSDNAKIKSFLDLNPVIIFASSYAPKLEEDEVNDLLYLSTPTWNPSDVIATDIKTGQEYIASELVNEKVVFPYKGEHDQEVYFFGQFNDNNHWDKNCIINVYNKYNELLMVTEAEYDDGNLLTYQQAIPSSDKKREWTVSKRVKEGDYNSGESWVYVSDKKYIKNFTLETVKSSDIYTIDKFKNTLGKNYIEYYNGNTSDGTYNDNTGNAYFVSYLSDGTVKTLYSGNFKNGQFDDDTGNAWYITRAEDTKYMYFKGKFQGGGTVKDKDFIFENNLSYEFINNIIKDKSFNCRLKWFEGEEAQKS